MLNLQFNPSDPGFSNSKIDWKTSPSFSNNTVNWKTRWNGYSRWQKALTILAALYIGNLYIGSSNVSACDCLDTVITGDTSVFKKCMDQDYDKAFDYAETYFPNHRYANQEAVLQSYWWDKCN